MTNLIRKMIQRDIDNLTSECDILHSDEAIKQNEREIEILENMLEKIDQVCFVSSTQHNTNRVTYKCNKDKFKEFLCSFDSEGMTTKDLRIMGEICEKFLGMYWDKRYIYYLFT